MINVTDFAGSCDSEIINNAIKARNKDGIVIIPPRECKEDTERDFRLLPASTHMYNIVIDNVVDTSPEGVCPKGGIIIGSYGRYGDNLRDGLTNVSISNVITKRENSILHFGYLKDSVISNVTNRVKGGSALLCRYEDGLCNCSISNLCSNEGEAVKYGDI